MMKIPLDVRHVSIWDNSSIIAVDAKLDIETGKISDIESVDTDGLCVLNSENIVVKLGSMTKVCEVIQDNDGDYAISADDLNIIKNNYAPIRNHLSDNAPFDGTMFETFGKELEFVRQKDNKRACWTLIEEDGKTLIEFGYSIANRLGYFITTHLPLNPNIQVLIEDRKEEHIKSLLDEVKQVLNDFISEEPLDESEINTLADIIKTAIIKHEENFDC